MIKGEGIMAFHGKMVYDPPNKKFRKELSGDFIHKQFDDEGYWYNDGWSYDDRFCVNIEEGMSLSELVEAIEKKVESIRGAVRDASNQEEIDRIIDKLTEELKGRGQSDGKSESCDD